MKRLFTCLVAVVLLAAMATPAHAAFHLFRIAEFFSSADGSVQFIRLHESIGANFQNVVGGQTITCSDGVTTHTFTIPTNLPSTNTANTDILIATSNFATLPGGVTPDYVIPAGFIFTGGGTMIFGGFVHTVNYGPMSTNGQTSSTAAGGTQVNTPRNFAGTSGSVNVPPGNCCVGTVCSITIQVSCAGQFAAGGVCTPNPCAPASGICCAGVTCRVDALANCSGASTLFVATPSCNSGGSTSTPCCRPDFNHVNGITVQDIFDYLAAWFAGATSADFVGNGAGTPDVQSIFNFLGAWFAGC